MAEPLANASGVMLPAFSSGQIWLILIATIWRTRFRMSWVSGPYRAIVRSNRMSRAAARVISLSFSSNELFAEAISSPTTNAESVTIMPIAMLMTALESAVRWCSGTTEAQNIPNSAPLKTHANTIAQMIKAIMLGSDSPGLTGGPQRRVLARSCSRNIESRQWTDMSLGDSLALMQSRGQGGYSGQVQCNETE